MTTQHLPAVRTVATTAVDTAPPAEDAQPPLTPAQKDVRWVLKLAVAMPILLFVAYLIGRFFPA